MLETDHQSSSYLGEGLPVSQGHQPSIQISSVLETTPQYQS